MNFMLIETQSTSTQTNDSLYDNSALTRYTSTNHLDGSRLFTRGKLFARSELFLRRWNAIVRNGLEQFRGLREKGVRRENV